jgi:hypothetical protein
MGLLQVAFKYDVILLNSQSVWLPFAWSAQGVLAFPLYLVAKRSRVQFPCRSWFMPRWGGAIFTQVCILLKGYYRWGDLCENYPAGIGPSGTGKRTASVAV